MTLQLGGSFHAHSISSFDFRKRTWSNSSIDMETILNCQRFYLTLVISKVITIITFTTDALGGVGRFSQFRRLAVLWWLQGV